MRGGLEAACTTSLASGGTPEASQEATNPPPQPCPPSFGAVSKGVPSCWMGAELVVGWGVELEPLHFGEPDPDPHYILARVAGGMTRWRGSIPSPHPHIYLPAAPLTSPWQLGGGAGQPQINSGGNISFLRHFAFKHFNIIPDLMRVTFSCDWPFLKHSAVVYVLSLGCRLLWRAILLENCHFFLHPKWMPPHWWPPLCVTPSFMHDILMQAPFIPTATLPSPGLTLSSPMLHGAASCPGKGASSKNQKREGEPGGSKHGPLVEQPCLREYLWPLLGQIMTLLVTWCPDCLVRCTFKIYIISKKRTSGVG